MRYLSVCSGIEAATVAWHPLGWKAVGYSEIEPFPSAVLKHHYPDVINFGDMTKYKEWNLETIDLVVGGTPCQSFSVAGLRKGLADPRGNLALIYCGILDHFRPKWFVWENVPGVLSSSGGRDFGSFLGALAELGYGFAYRVLDAQFFGVAQRRRRVFVVGYLGDWRPAAEVLFERESVRGDPSPSRDKGEKVAGTFTARARSGGWGHDPNLAAYALQGAGHTSQNSQGSGWNKEVSFTLNCMDVHGVAQPIAFAQNQRDEVRELAVAGALAAEPGMKQQTYIAFNARQDPDSWQEHTGPLDTDGSTQAVAVRRLTPVECERLQGFPDNYTNIPWRKQPESPDGPRYKALGNSMAVPVMAWIGRKIAIKQLQL